MKKYVQFAMFAAMLWLMMSCVPIKKYNQLNKSIGYKTKDLERLKQEHTKLNSLSVMLRDSLNSIGGKQF